jgi:hypothetical protein
MMCEGGNCSIATYKRVGGWGCSVGGEAGIVVGVVVVVVWV